MSFRLEFSGKQEKLPQNANLVVFSEFGSRAKDNGKGTNHGTAARFFCNW